MTIQGGHMRATGPVRFSPTHPIGYAELLIRNRIDAAVGRRRSTTREVGASVVEWVIITALLVGMAVAVGAILFQKVNDKANDLDLNSDL